MSKPRNALCAFLIAISSPATAQDATMQAGKPEHQAIYLAGAVTALVASNVGAARVFCAPASYVLNASEMRRLAASQLTGPQDPTTFVIAAMEALREEFPCP